MSRKSTFLARPRVRESGPECSRVVLNAAACQRYTVSFHPSRVTSPARVSPHQILGSATSSQEAPGERIGRCAGGGALLSIWHLLWRLRLLRGLRVYR